MRASVILVCALAEAAVAAVVPRNNAVTTVTVTVACERGSATNLPASASPIQAFTTPSTSSAVADISYSGAGVILGPVSGPDYDPSGLSNIVPKSNLTLYYGSNDTSTPDSNARISLQMNAPSVLLENIPSVYSVVCSDTRVVVIFTDVVGYEKSKKEWPAVGDFILFTNHLGNCDVEYERGLFFVGGLTFDEITLTVTAMAERSNFQSTAGSMQIDFGQDLGSLLSNSTSGPYSNTTALSKRDVHWDPTYSMNFNTALAPDTIIASVGSSINVIANTASFTSSASFKGHLDYDFWRAKIRQLYVDLDVAFDAKLNLTTSINAEYSHSFQYAPSSLAVAPIIIPGILTLGPALSFAIGAQTSAEADVHIDTQTEVSLQHGNAHVDFIHEANTAASGWTPKSSASATPNAAASVELNPYVLLGVELAVDFLGGLLDLSSGIRANATLSNRLTAIAEVEAGLASGASVSTDVPAPAGAVNGACENGLQYKSDFHFGIEGFVTSFYTREIWAVEAPLFDRCWGWGVPQVI